MHEVKLPQLGQSVEEASIVAWHKHEGDRVEKGDILFSIQTDKAEIECESTAGGILRKILIEPDVTVPVLTVVALVGEAAEPLPDFAAVTKPLRVQSREARDATAPEAAQVSTASAAISLGAAVGRTAVSPRAKAAAKREGVNPALIGGSGVGGRVMEADVLSFADARKAIRITPTARRMAQNEGIDIAAVRGTGPHGKIMKSDLAQAGTAPSLGPPTSLPATTNHMDGNRLRGHGIAGRDAGGPSDGGVRRVPLSPMRRIIAKRMSESKFTAPHYYVTVEVDMTAAVQYRASLSPFKPSYNDLIVLATARAIQQWPAVNARWVGDAIEEVADVNLGIAVALPTGLIVPVLRRVQAKSLEAISRESRELAEKARTGKLLPDEYTGSTFTISNLGAFGVDQFTAIINQPDSAILAVGQIKDRPVVIDGGIHIRPIVKLTLSSDHRVIDGAVAAQFIGCLKEMLETAGSSLGGQKVSG